MKKHKHATPLGLLFFLFLNWSCALTPPETRLDLSVDQAASLTPGYSLAQEEAQENQSAEPSDAPTSLDALTPAETDQTLEQEVQDLDKLGSWEEGDGKQLLVDEITYDFPVTINKQVEYYLDFFQNKQHQTFSLWLARSGRYLPLITKELEEAGLPTDLAYLPMIESGYNLTAYSKAKAVGPWQFIRATAVHYNLRVDDYVDERRDPVRSTQAAVRYLSDLYAMFDSWHLAVAGYNAGEGRIQKAVRRYKTTNFWELAQQRYLNIETKRYVPKLIAAIMIAKSPEEYGFTDIQYETPLEFDTIKVPRWTNLQAVATATNCALDEIVKLNLQLRQKVTPPDMESCEIKVPKGKGEIASNNLPRIHVAISTAFKSHTIRKNDTIASICRKYNLNKKTLLKANNLRKAKLVAGNVLRIPYQVQDYKLLSKEEMANRNHYASSHNQFILHTIKPGETLSQIATLYGVSPQRIASWNDLTSINKIQAGQQLSLYITPLFANNAVGITANTTHQSLGIEGDEPPRKHEVTYYKVQGGDNLWTIARKFNIRSADIMRWNNLKDNLIHPGLELILQKEI